MTLRQFVSVALGAAALVRGLVAVSTLGLSELAIYAGSKAMASFGTKAPPSEGVLITLPGRSGIAMQG